MPPFSLVHIPQLLVWLVALLSLPAFVSATEWIDYPADGTATLTHYTLPDGYIASCGCTGASTQYPTAAMSQYAYGSSTAYGPGCGRCFQITLLNTYTGTPPFFPNVTKSVVIKVTDLCPVGGAGWCSATPDKPNQSGQYINFDLAWPSKSIPDDFFPSDEAFYGDRIQDFGVWNVSYKSVNCLDNWAGAKNAAALGSVDDGSSVCCPANPTVSSTNDTCPSYSDDNGIPPDTTTTGSAPSLLPLYTLFVSCLLGPWYLFA
ncbi:RlpA-like double-psi beta-barrel-protein domain-containing protein-containing protein [Epithele typhae]|uniref:RlpA-like double-psi beta-barrel-protein domain-containing protein-containing protein n=1 Tax=Epithele typhae TaxID=378194 RepID=UPI002007DF1A|nr:RlpA-like double-psi beta-barrel-protein domain-containing protein-containing protein [Epithele typhae]KAH9931086.1 RlpA-like double-psi beta-barrel-protein domain-containing protein-containing protein [Epithele typhae]